MSDSTLQRNTLSPQKIELLELLLKQKGIESKKRSAIARRPNTGASELSFAQQRMLFLEQFGAGRANYNIPTALRLVGQLNVSALEQSIAEVARRHESLRATFIVAGERQLQIIAPPSHLTAPVADLRELPVADRERATSRLGAQEFSRPFDLVCGPVFRFTLMKLNAEVHILFFTLHHIVSDGWSIGVLIRELAKLYEEFSTGKPSSLDELPIQYADFAAWQKEHISGGTLETQLAYWKKRIGNNPPVLNLPCDRARPALQTFRGACHRILLPAELTERLNSLSRSERKSLFAILLAAFNVLLSRYSGQQDIVVGTPIANRDRPELEGLIGLLLNTLVFRADLSGDPSFRELASRINQQVLESHDYQDIPFEKLVDELSPERDPARSPLAQVYFGLEQSPPALPETSQVTISPVEFERDACKFDLVLEQTIVENRLVVCVTYNTDLFDSATIRRFARHYWNLLENVASHKSAKLSELQLLTPAECHQMLAEWNDKPTDYPAFRFIHQVIEAHAEQKPDCVAAIFEGQHLTYEALNSNANQVAHYLRSLGVGLEVIVGICLDRSLDILTAVLGTLKAGGAFLPLDPGYPQERLAYMMEDSAASVLLTHRSLLDKFPESATKAVLLDDRDLLLEQSRDNPCCEVYINSAAYMIYTSGSTGRSKGVLIEHKGLYNLSENLNRMCGTGLDTRMLQFASFSFDASIFEMLLVWQTGATLCLAPRERILPGLSLTELIDEEAITAMIIPPSALSVLPEQALASLRTVITGGEACSANLVEKWSIGRRFINAYGPTEITICSNMMQCEIDDRKPAIGRAISNTQSYLLDSRMQPVVIGAAGVLHIGGIGVGRGYWNRPDLTAERFIPDPFSHESGCRMYISGDVCSHRPDGNIEYMGRVDHQVKIHGFRIETGEIEATLAQHAELLDAVVIARDDSADSKRLVAYIVPKQMPGPGVDSLRHFLQSKLPLYMVPSAFVALDKFPLTQSGKIDRKQLPRPADARPQQQAGFAAPRTPVERLLADIWAKVLRIDQVGIYDNFFNLGGDSILSIQISAKANQAGLRLVPQQLFQHQTIESLATVADAAPVIVADQKAVIGRVPLLPIQLWFFEQELPDRNHFNQAVLIETRQKVRPDLLEQALSHLARHHDALRHRFEKRESGWEQVGVEPAQQVAFSVIDFSALPDPETGRAIESEAARLQASLNIFDGSLVRIALFDLGPQRASRLLLIIHHLVVDGVSWRILLDDLQTIYRQLSGNEPVQIPAKTTSLKHWSERLKEYAQSIAAKAEMDYWTSRPFQRAERLPVDNPGGINCGASARTFQVTLAREETLALLREVPSAYKTQVGDALLTALVRAFARWTGSRFLLLEMEGHGREAIIDGADLSRTVGWFTTLFPVLLETKKDADLIEVFKSVKEHLRSIPNQGIGYGLLRYLSEDKEISRRMRSLPRAEVSFNYMGQFDQLAQDSSLFLPARESFGPLRSDRGERSHLIEINASVVTDQLQLRWTYSENRHNRSTIERVTGWFIEELRSLIEQCRACKVGGYTPSDFPLARIDQPTLNALMAGGRQVEDIYSLTPLQQGMFVRTLYAPATGTYLNQVSCSLIGHLNIAALRQAWQSLIDRHPVWRTAFLWEGLEDPLQVVFKQVELPWTQFDWRGRTEEAQKQMLESFLREDFERDFDLSRSPLMRITLIEVAENTHQLIWSFHHLVMDGWSGPLLLKEVFALYYALSEGREIQLGQPRPFRDYIAWLAQQERAEAEAFWRQALKGFTSPTPLPINRPQVESRAQTERYCEKHLLLSSEATANLQTLCRQQQLTVNTIIQGIWALLLSHCSGRRDVVYGAVVSGRPAELTGIEAMLGPFINTLPVRAQIIPDQSFLFWLKQLQAQQVEMRRYEHSSLVEVQGWSEVPRSEQLFESILVFENYPVDDDSRQSNQNLKIDNVRSAVRNHYPFTVRASLNSNLSIKILYDGTRLDQAAIDDVLGHFERLLLAMIDDRQATLKSLASLIVEAERGKRKGVQKEFQEARRDKLRSIKRRGVTG